MLCDLLVFIMITSMHNSKIKEVVRLRDRRERNQSHLFLIEGYREIRRALEAGRLLTQLFYCPELFLGSNEDALLQNSRTHCIRCTPEVFAKISYRDRPDGLLAVAPQYHLSLTDLSPISNPFLLLAERIEKPGNLGSILRSCDAVGVDAVCVCDPMTDIHNPNVVRASVGTLFTQPVCEMESTEVFTYLQTHRITLVAATPQADLDYTKGNYTGPIAIAVGAEQVGLSEEWLRRADLKVRIPMRGVSDSLNVAAATTLLLYEVFRQRIIPLPPEKHPRGLN
jgi:RNA methyltransferase, TrmH family